MNTEQHALKFLEMKVFENKCITGGGHKFSWCRQHTVLAVTKGHLVNFQKFVTCKTFIISMIIATTLASKTSTSCLLLHED